MTSRHSLSNTNHRLTWSSNADHRSLLSWTDFQESKIKEKSEIWLHLYLRFSKLRAVKPSRTREQNVRSWWVGSNQERLKEREVFLLKALHNFFNYSLNFSSPMKIQEESSGAASALSIIKPINKKAPSLGRWAFWLLWKYAQEKCNPSS